MDDNEKARQEAEAAEAQRAAEAAKAQEAAVEEQPAYRPFDPYIDIDTNCYRGTAHGAPVGPMTQGCGPLGRAPFGNRDNLRPLGTGDPDAMYTEPTVERDTVSEVGAFKEGEAGYSDYQKRQLASHQKAADKVTQQGKGSKSKSGK